MIMPQRNAVELSSRVKQVDRWRRAVCKVSLCSLFRGEVIMGLPFYRTRACALPAGRVRPLGDFVNRFPSCFLQFPRGKKPPARKRGGGQRGALG
jgi:hypothetical protein